MTAEAFLAGHRDVYKRQDVTGEGNVNSKDVTLLQKYLCDNAELDGAYLKAADFNLDATSAP